jgi:tetratricopeptide (TPR) repeat protein
MILVLAVRQPLQAQIGPIGLPNQGYYNTFFEFYGGDYKNAVKDFTNGAQTAYRFGTDRYLDSVCYWTMIGECHYHMGNYSEALNYYRESLKLYLAYNAAAWQSRVTVPEITARQQVDQRANVNWGISQRRGGIANIPDGMMTLFGRLDAGRAFSEGGIVDAPEQRSINVREIMRCTALALHRWHTIKGATCKYDDFTATLVTGLSGPRANNALLGTWNNVLLGIAQASMEDYALARQTLTNSLQVAGMDHNLTPVALLELAIVSFASGDNVTAAQMALEASFSAAVFGQYDMIEEALSLGTTLHLMTNRTPYPPLQPAIEWAAQEKARLLNVSLIERLTACYVEAGDTETASRVLGEARRLLSRTSLSQAVVNSRLRFAVAQISLMKGDQESGLSELSGALKEFQTGSKWLYQLGLSDSLVLSGEVSGRRADQLYSALLRDPTETEWTIDPMECLAFLTTPHVAAMERWFETKLLNKQYDEAIEVAELVRRHRFFSNLPLGGRLVAMRWILEGPDEALTPQMQDQRRNFLSRIPDYKQLSDRASEIRNELLTLPLKPDADSAEAKKQTELFVELAKVSKAQEAIILSFAVRRQSADMAFPPQNIDISKLYERIQPHQVAFVMLATGNGVHSFIVTSDTAKYLGTTSTRNVVSSVGKFLKDIGLQDNSGGVDLDELTGDSWKVDANVVARNIFIDNSDMDWSKYTEMIVVPDGVLWYVPFELLQIETEVAAAPANAGALDPADIDPDADPDDPAKAADSADNKSNKKKPKSKKASVDPATLTALGDQLLIRYAPTLYLGIGSQRPERRLARTAVISGRMHPKAEIEQTQQVAKEIQLDIPDAVNFEDKMPIPSGYYGAIVDRFVVCSDIRTPDKGGPFAVLPAQLDQGLTGSNLASWLSLPLWGPEYVVLPGFTSGGAAGGRGKGDGQDVFLTACGVLASGSRALMISRWRVGGRNSLELTRNYARNLNEMTPAKALREAVKVSRQVDLDPDAEPRIKQKKSAAPVKAEPPFFWAGYMVIEVPNPLTSALSDQKMVNDNPGPPAAADIPAGAAVPDIGGQLNDAPPGDNQDPVALPQDPNLPDRPADKDGKVMQDDRSKPDEKPKPKKKSEDSGQVPSKSGGG